MLFIAALLAPLSWHTGTPAFSSLLKPAARAAVRMEYGDNIYEGALEPLPDNVYEVLLERPLGIGFAEDGPNFGKNGVSVEQVVPGSNAAKGSQIMKKVGGANQAVDGKVEVGDKLIGVTAIKFIGSKWERCLFECRKWAYDTVVDAIGSNTEKFVSNYVILQFEKPAAAAAPEPEPAEAKREEV